MCTVRNGERERIPSSAWRTQISSQSRIKMKNWKQTQDTDKCNSAIIWFHNLRPTHWKGKTLQIFHSCVVTIPIYWVIFQIKHCHCHIPQFKCVCVCLCSRLCFRTFIAGGWNVVWQVSSAKMPLFVVFCLFVCLFVCLFGCLFVCLSLSFAKI